MTRKVVSAEDVKRLNFHDTPFPETNKFDI